MKLQWRAAVRDPGDESFVSQLVNGGVYWVMHHGKGSPWLVVFVPQRDAPEVSLGRFRGLATAKQAAQRHATYGNQPTTKRARRNPGRLSPRAYGLVMGGVPQWVVDQGIAPGDRIRFQQYAGSGRQGPEYKPATGRVHLLGPAGPVVVLPGDRFGARPTVVTQEHFLGVVSRKRNPPARRPRRVPARDRKGRRLNPVLGIIANSAPAVFTVSTRVKEIVYIHAQDGREYVHPFAPGVSATFLQDGRCVLWRRDGKPIAGRRIGNTIKPIGG